MRPIPALFAIAAVAGGTDMLGASPAGAQCSVLSRHPCMPTVCSVLRHRPCVPEIEYPLGEDLRLTIVSAPSDRNTEGADAAPRSDTGEPKTEAEHRLDSIRGMFAALRECWIPPPEGEARPGMQMSVRLSFKRTGEIIGIPRVTYTSPDAPPAARDTYHGAIMAALDRCTPLPFSRGLGGAVAGRPIAIRFIDNRKSE